jgi:hypothetical protein
MRTVLSQNHWHESCWKPRTPDGGPNRLSVFQNKNLPVAPGAPVAPIVSSLPPANPTIAGYDYIGCHVDSVALRVLSGSFLYDATTMTMEKCALFCAPYDFFGVEHDGECYCDNALENPTEVVADSVCSFNCPGSVASAPENCGAGNRLTMYRRSVGYIISNTLLNFIFIISTKILVSSNRNNHCCIAYSNILRHSCFDLLKVEGK